MPYIAVKVSGEISPEKEQSLTAKLGEAMSLIGKTESWLMIDFSSCRHMYFKRSNEARCAFIEVKLLGGSDRASYEKMTAAITAMINEELAISPDRIYVKYEEAEHWGWNGRNF